MQLYLNRKGVCICNFELEKETFVNFKFSDSKVIYSINESVDCAIY